MKKRLFLLLLLACNLLNVSGAEELEKPVECAKLSDLMRHVATLEDRFARAVGDVDQREKEINREWGNLTLAQRQDVEKECAALHQKLTAGLEKLQLPTAPKDNFPEQCERAIALTEKANDLMSDEEKVSATELAELNQQLRQTWQQINLQGQQKMINACVKMEEEINALIKEKTQP